MGTKSGVRFDTSDLALQTALRTRVQSYFTERGLSRHADGRMVAKLAIYLGAAAGFWALLVSGIAPAWVAAPPCLAFGVVMAGVGFNVAHDAIHGALFARPWLNKLFSHSFDLMGASSYTWSRAHNFVHHTYTNVPGLDEDLEPGPWLILYPRENPAFIYRFQHFFALPLYAWTTLVWVFKKDFQQAFANDPRTGQPTPKLQIAQMLAWKLVHFALFLGVPLALGAYAWWQVVVGYVLMHAAMGVTSAVVFQLAHVVEGPSLIVPNDVQHGWVAHQLLTTANFSPDSPIAAFLFGGLNRQIEHHLLSKICHIHYPALAPIVREVAREHGLPYFENATFFDALSSHLRVLQQVGLPQDSELRLAAEES
jgi:linoleoyl-CoA desaturase